MTKSSGGTEGRWIRNQKQTKSLMTKSWAGGEWGVEGCEGVKGVVSGFLRGVGHRKCCPRVDILSIFRIIGNSAVGMSVVSRLVPEGMRFTINGSMDEMRVNGVREGDLACIAPGRSPSTSTSPPADCGGGTAWRFSIRGCGWSGRPAGGRQGR